MLLSIIIINYNTSAVTAECVNSIYSHLSSEIGRNVELIVVDNNSQASELEAIKKLRDQKGFKLATSQINLGFGGGCNFGVSLAVGEIYLFINSDTKLSDSSLIKMADFLKSRPDFGISGGRMISPTGVQEKSAGKFYGLLNLFLMLTVGERVPLVRFSPSKNKRVDWVSGGFMMVKRKAFDEVSGFDEDYFMYLEDLDICMRARKKGYLTYYYFDSSIIHAKHGSSNRAFAIYHIFRSLMVFYRKNKSELEYNIARLLLFLKAFFALLVGQLFRRDEMIHTYKKVFGLFKTS